MPGTGTMALKQRFGPAPVELGKTSLVTARCIARGHELPQLSLHGMGLISLTRHSDGSITYSFGPPCERGYHVDVPAEPHLLFQAGIDRFKADARRNGKAKTSVRGHETASKRGREAASKRTKEPAGAHAAAATRSFDFELLPSQTAAATPLALSHTLPSHHGAAVRERDALSPGHEHRVTWPLTGGDSLDTLPRQAIFHRYNALCASGQLDATLALLEACRAAGRLDVLERLRQTVFLRRAAENRAVPAALRFLQLLPRSAGDKRTYNMVLGVCAAAGDLRAAQRVLDMARTRRDGVDAAMLTQVLRACAVTGDVDAAFGVYRGAREARLPLDRQLCTTLVAVCASRAAVAGAGDRRGALVALERALSVLADMRAARLTPDAAAWNALITTAGRAGELQRAQSLAREMARAGCRPDTWTHTALVDAAARGGSPTDVRAAYTAALAAGVGAGSQACPLYTAAIVASARGGADADAEAGLRIYDDMRRNNVTPDATAYSVLIQLAERAGRPGVAASLQVEMAARGIAVAPSRLGGAKKGALLAGAEPGMHVHATRGGLELQLRGSSLVGALQAAAAAGSLGDVVMLVEEAVGKGVRPDQDVFGAVLAACHSCGESALGLQVHRAMKLMDVDVEEAHATLLLRMCYAGQRPASRQAGSGAPAGEAPEAYRKQQGRRLLQALWPEECRPARLSGMGEVDWHLQASEIFKHTTKRQAGGLGSQPRLLELALRCLRVPWVPRLRPEREGHEVAWQPFQGLGSMRYGRPGMPASPLDWKVGIEAVYHRNALAILEECIASGALPNFSLRRGSKIDLRGMSPAVAEVYALSVVAAMQCLIMAGEDEAIATLVLKVPPYNASSVLKPSHSAAPPAHPPAQPAARVGLGVAGVLRRLRLWTKEDGEAGRIVLERKTVLSWTKRVTRLLEERRNHVAALNNPCSHASQNPLLSQRRSIRSLDL
ncbi:MRL1 [Auxenochlorella protothecoides x Auxenochlorella symbiontica]